MDFHSMKRNELQKLCKKHNIPANISNLDMVDKLSSLLKVQEKEEERPMRKTRSCLKSCDEMLSENESDALKKKSKKVRFSPQNDVFQLGEKSERGFVVDNKGGAGRVTRGGSKLAKTIMISPVMKKRGKRAVQEVEKEDLVGEDMDGASRVTRARTSLGKSVVISSPVVMKKRGKRALHGDEKGNLAVKNNVGGATRVTRARELLGEKVLTSPVVIKKRGKKAMQEDEKEDLVVENEGGASRVTRARAGKQVLISSPVVMKKRGKRAVQEKKKIGSASFLPVDFTSPAVEEENEVITVKFLRNRKVENVVSPKNIARKRDTQNRSQGVNAAVSENKDAVADGGITQTRQSKRNRMEFTQAQPLEENLGATEKAGRRNITRSRNQFEAKASNVGRESETRDVSEGAKEVVVQVKEPLRRSGRHVNTEHTNLANDSEMPIKSDESTRYQTRHGPKRMSVMPQMKKAKMEKPVAGNLGKKNVDSPSGLTKPIVMEKGSGTGHMRRSKRNASEAILISEDANGSGTDIKTGTTKKRRRDAVLEEVPSQHTGRRVNRRADNISDKLEEETPVASEPRTRSGNRQNSSIHSAKKLNMSGNLGPSRTTGEKASPHYTRGLSSVPRTETGVRQSKTVAVTPRTRSGSGQKSFTHAAKKLRISDNSGLHKTIGDKESPHKSREFSVVTRRSETESKVRGSKTESEVRGSKSKQTPVINEHPRRFTRSALKGKTDGAAPVRRKIYQKKSQSVSKLPLSKVNSSSPMVISASEGPLDINVQSSYGEVDRSTNNLVANASDLPEDKTACSTPQGGSAKTCSVDLNLQESEGPKLINIHEVSSSDPLKLQSDHAELEVDISAGEHTHAPVGKPASYDVHSPMPQVVGCSTDPISDTNNSCGGIVTCAILRDSTTEANDETPVHIMPAEGLDVAGDAAFIDRDSVNDGFSSLEQITSKGMEVNPQTIKYVEPSSGGITNVVLEGSTVCEEQSMNQLPFPEVGCSTIPVSKTGDVNEDNTTATQKENSCESNVASAHLVHLKADAAAGDAFLVETNALADISPVDQSTSTRDEERPQTSKDVESTSKGIDLNLVFEGPAIHEDESVYQLPLPEVEEFTDIPVTGNSEAVCVTQQEGCTEIDAKSPPLVHLKSADDVDIIGDAGSIDGGSVDDYLLNVEQINLSVIKEKQEVSKNVDHVAEGSTVDEEKLTAVGDCGPTEQEQDIRDHSAEFVESGRLDKDSRNASEKASEASCADLTNQSVSMIFTEEKDDTMHPETSVHADETPNTSSESGMQEKECPVPNSILTTEGVSILEYEFSNPEFSDIAMCSNKELADDSNQRLSTVESCLMKEESRMNKCVEFSTSEVVADSVVGGSNKPEPKDPSSPSCVAEVGNLVVEVNEELKPEDSPSNRSSDIFERAAADGSSLKKEQSSVISADVSEYNQSKNAKDESEISKNASALDSSCREMSDMPKFISSLTSNFTEVGHLPADVNEQKPEDSLSLRMTEILPERAAENGSSLHKESSSVILADGSEHNQPDCARGESEIRERVNMLDSTTRESTDMPEYISVSQTFDHNIGGKCSENDLSSSSISLKKMVAFEVDTELTSKGQEYRAVGIEGREVEETVFEDTMEKDSERASSMYGDAHNILDDQLHIEREWDLEDMTFSISGDVEERRMNKNSSTERTPVISEDDIDRDGIAGPVIVHKFPSSADDHCHTQSEDSCGKEQVSDMSMVKSSRNFGKEFFSEHDYCHRPVKSSRNFGKEFFSEHDYCHRPLKDSCGKEQGTPMSMVKGSKNCGEDFSSQHDNVIEHVKVCSAAALTQTICEDFAGFDNQMVADLMGSTGRRISRTGALNNEKLEETEPCTAVITDKIVHEDGIELLKGNSSNLIQNLAGEGGGSYCEKSDIEIITYDVSEEDLYGKDTIDSNRSEDALQQFDMNDGETDSNIKGICQENDGRPIPVQMDVDTNNVESSRDNLIAIQGFDQEADASGVPTEELPRNEGAMDSDALVNLQYGGESVTLTGQTNEAQGGLTEDIEIITYDVSEEDRYGKDTIDSNRSEDAVQQFDMNDGETDSNVKEICQENDGRPIPVQMDVDTNNVESSRDNLIAIQGFDQEANASGVPTEELPRNEGAMDSDALANLQYGGESVTLTGQTNEAQAGGSTEELSTIEDAMGANAPANMQYGYGISTLTGEANDAQEHKSRSDEMDGEESDFWYGNTTGFIPDKSEVAGKEVDIFSVPLTEEQLHNSGEEYAREESPESIEIQHEAFKNPGTGDDHVSVENSVGTRNGTHLKSEASKEAHQKVDCCNNNTLDEDFTKNESCYNMDDRPLQSHF